MSDPEPPEDSPGDVVETPSSEGVPVSTPVVTPTTPAPQPPMVPNMAEMEPEPNVLVPMETFFTEGCVYIGGYNRVFVYQRDTLSEICTDLSLVADDEASPFDLTALTIPERWTVEDMTAYRCTPEGAIAGGATATYYTRASGRIAFEPARVGSLPDSAELDVLLSAPADDVGTLPEQMIMDRKIVAPNLELLGSCRTRP